MIGIYSIKAIKKDTLNRCKDSEIKGISANLFFKKDSLTASFEFKYGQGKNKAYAFFIGKDLSAHIISLINDPGAIKHLKWRGYCLIVHESPPEDNESSFTIISDRIGSHRIYYSFYDGLFIFSDSLSKLIDLKRDLGHAIELDKKNIPSYLRFLHVPETETLFKGIKTIPPASILAVSDKGIVNSTYWEPEFTPLYTSEKDAVSDLEQILNKHVGQKICSADKKTGLFLSGGLDSSLIASLFRENGKNLYTYTVGFRDEEDEREDARAVAEYFNAKHREIMIGPNDIDELLWEAIKELGFPTGNPSSIATGLIARRSRDDCERLLSGLGSDELFAGHKKHILARHWQIGNRLLSLRRLMMNIIKNAPYDFTGSPKNIKRFNDLYAFFDRDEIIRIVAQECPKQALEDYSGIRRDRFSEEEFLTDIYVWLSDDLLPFINALTLQHGISLELPLCTDEMLEFAARVPLSMKVKGTRGKWILRKACHGLLPAWITEKGRRGFTLPMGRWLRGTLAHLLHTYLSEETVKKRGIFRPEAIRKILDIHISGRHDLSIPIWGLLTLEIWQRIFLDNRG